MRSIRSGCAPVSCSREDGWRQRTGRSMALRYPAHAPPRAHRGRRRRRRGRCRGPLRDAYGGARRRACGAGLGHAPRPDRQLLGAGRPRGRARRRRLARPALGATPRSPGAAWCARAPPRRCAAMRRRRSPSSSASACSSTPTATATSRSASRAATRAAGSSTRAAARRVAASCASSARSSSRPRACACSRTPAPPRCGPPTAAASASCATTGARFARAPSSSPRAAPRRCGAHHQPAGLAGARPAAGAWRGRVAGRRRVHAVPPHRGDRHPGPRGLPGHRGDPRRGRHPARTRAASASSRSSRRATRSPARSG